MATIRQRPSGAWEVIVRDKSLPRPHYATLDTEAQAREYAAKIEASIKQGCTPRELLETPAERISLGQLVKLYQKQARISAHDSTLLPRIPASLLDLRAELLTVGKLLEWVADMHAGSVAPGTIRKKVGALGRCLDWAVLTGRLGANPAKSLPRNYAAYPNAHENRRKDTERDRRLHPGEEERIRKVLEGRDDWLRLFGLALETGMRLREMFTLDWQQVSLEKRTVFLDKTKNGDKRQVPLSSVALALLTPHGGQGLVFPWWDGSEASLANTTCKLSHQWTRIAKGAGCEDLHFHDIRHEAVCRLYERTSLSDLQISRITGHKSMAVLRRYSNLRGSDLAGSLW